MPEVGTKGTTVEFFLKLNQPLGGNKYSQFTAAYSNYTAIYSGLYSSTEVFEP